MFNLNPKHKILLDGFIEQDLPYQCPECNTELTIHNTIGFGTYPQRGFRSTMKPNQLFGQGFECPKCFIKSCCHSNEYMYQLYLDSQR
jgi:hypothetical protein